MKFVKVFNKTKDTLMVECFNDDGIIFEDVLSGQEKVIGEYDIKNNKYYISMRKRGFRVDFVDIVNDNFNDVIKEKDLTVSEPSTSITNGLSESDVVEEIVYNIENIVPVEIKTDNVVNVDNHVNNTVETVSVENTESEEKPKSKRGRRKKTEVAEQQTEIAEQQ